MSRSLEGKDSVVASVAIGFDVTPHATDPLPEITTGVMVSEDDVEITGYLEGDKSTPHTTFGLKAGVIHPFRFYRITAVSLGTVKGYTA